MADSRPPLDCGASRAPRRAASGFSRAYASAPGPRGRSDSRSARGHERARRARRLGRLAAAALGVDALAVRRVHHDGAVIGRGQALQRVGRLELDRVRDARALRVAGGEVGHAKRHVAGPDRHRGLDDGVARLDLQLAPARGVLPERLQALEREAARQARRDVAGDLRGLDRDRAGAAARVQQAAVLGSAVPAGRVDQRRRQRLLQRRLALLLAPAALEQGLAAEVDRDPGVRRVDVQADREIREARVDAGPRAGHVAHHVADGVLDAQRGEVQALQRRALCGDVHADGLVRRDPLRPVDAAPEVVQVVFVAVVAVHHRPQHALRDAAAQVQAHRVLDAFVDHHAAAPGNHALVRADDADAFLGEQFLAAVGAGDEEEVGLGVHGGCTLWHVAGRPLLRTRKMTRPCGAGWPARSSRLHDTWPRCGAPPGCPGLRAARRAGCRTAAWPGSRRPRAA